MRSDLPHGFAAAQITHAAGESSDGDIKPGTNAVVVSVGSERDLHLLERRLTRAAIKHTTIYEPDAPWNGQMTAIGIAPTADRRPIQAVVGSLPLYGREKLREAV